MTVAFSRCCLQSNQSDFLQSLGPAGAFTLPNPKSQVFLSFFFLHRIAPGDCGCFFFTPVQKKKSSYLYFSCFHWCIFLKAQIIWHFLWMCELRLCNTVWRLRLKCKPTIRILLIVWTADMWLIQSSQVLNSVWPLSYYQLSWREK